MNANDQRDEMLQRLRSSLSKAEDHMHHLRREDAALVYASLAASSLGTIVAGLAAALGPTLGKGPLAWKVTCALVAALTASATILSGVHKQQAVPVRLGKASACVLKLRALEMDMTLGSRDAAQVAKEYQELAVNYLEFVT
ncbi:MAG: hypothetical protein WB819_14095 [Terriglobia bacterium]|jgi:hypothetical protein